MKKNVIAAFAAVLVALVAVACAGQPAHETQQESAPGMESTAQAPADQAAPAEGAPVEGAPAEGAPAAEGTPAEAPPQN